MAVSEDLGEWFRAVKQPGCQAMLAVFALAQVLAAPSASSQDIHPTAQGSQSPTIPALLQPAAAETTLPQPLHVQPAVATQSSPGLNPPEPHTKLQSQRLAQVMPGTSSPDKLIAPPGENAFFPVRTDGQPYILNIDTTVNLTDALNRYYFNPRWRGEVWTPFDRVDEIERATRLMSTWFEYDQENIYRKGDPVAKWFERLSGFGP